MEIGLCRGSCFIILQLLICLFLISEPTATTSQTAKDSSSHKQFGRELYDLPKNGHIPSHYDLLPTRETPSSGNVELDSEWRAEIRPLCESAAHSPRTSLVSFPLYFDTIHLKQDGYIRALQLSWRYNFLCRSCRRGFVFLTTVYGKKKTFELTRRATIKRLVNSFAAHNKRLLWVSSAVVIIRGQFCVFHMTCSLNTTNFANSNDTNFLKMTITTVMLPLLGAT